jgi:hypothetical protein
LRFRLAAIATRPAALAGRVLLAGQHRHEWIVSKLVVIVEVFVSVGQPVDPLAHEFLNGMFSQVRIAVIGEARRQLADHADHAFGLAQKQPAAVRRDMPAVKRCRNFSSPEGVKCEILLGTLCFHQAATSVSKNCPEQQNFRTDRGSFQFTR